MEVENKPKTKTFKEYYNDEEYKKKHRLYMTEKIDCLVCECSIDRVNMARHNRTSKHIRNEENKKYKDNLEILTNMDLRININNKEDLINFRDLLKNLK